MAAKRGDTSAASAARFIALRKNREPYEQKRDELLAHNRNVVGQHNAERAREVVARVLAVPKQWRYVEKHFPGAHEAWVKSMAINSEEFMFGITQRRAFAIDQRCYTDMTNCRCLVFNGASWQPWPHKALVGQ